MSETDRGGSCIKTGKIGRVNILRQQVLLPGETLRARVRGQVRLEAMRERDVSYIDARLYCFATPIRWLWDQWPTYVTEGPSTSLTVPVETLGSTLSLSDYGIGGSGDPSKTFFRWYKDAPLRIWNEWFKWPEDGDTSAWEVDGLPMMPLPMPWSRYQLLATPSAETEITLGATLDVQQLAEQQARFRAFVERDQLAYQRYMDVLKGAYGADGSREVDQVPMLLSTADVSVRPDNIPATDAAGLGQFQALYNFNVDHDFGSMAFPEHTVITYVLGVRYASIAINDWNFNAQDVGRTWHDIVGDPGMLAAQERENVNRGDLYGNQTSTTPEGALPAGWRWRARHNLVGTRIADRGSFPFYNNASFSNRYATNVDNAFRSTSLGDYVAHLDFTEMSYNPLAPAMSSMFSGMGSGKSKNEFSTPRAFL